MVRSVRTAMNGNDEKTETKEGRVLELWKKALLLCVGRGLTGHEIACIEFDSLVLIMNRQIILTILH